MCSLLVLVIQTVESRADQALKARRDRKGALACFLPASRFEHSLVLQHPHGLFEEQRVPAGIRDQRFGELGLRERGVSDELAQELACLRRRAGRSSSARFEPEPPANSASVSRNSGRAVQIASSGGAVVRHGQILEQLDQRGLRPVEVLEHEDRRLSCREELSRAPQAPVQLTLRDLAGGVRAPRCHRDADDVGKRRGDGAELVRDPGSEVRR